MTSSPSRAVDGNVPRTLPVLLLAIVVGVLALSGCAKDAVSGVKVPKPAKGEILKIDSRQGRSLLDSDRRVLLLDVRTVREYMKGHVVGAQIADMSDDKAWDFRLSELDRNKPVMVYCRDTACSHDAAQRLVEAGFVEVYDLGDPGMWDSRYLPIDKRGKS